MADGKFKKYVLVFLVILTGFLLIIFYLKWETEKMRQRIERVSGFPDFPQTREQTSFSPTGEEKIFISPDGKMQFKHSDHWQEMENGELSFFPMNISQQVETFFSAQKMSLTSLGILTAGEILSGKREEVISNIKESFLSPQHQITESEEGIIIEDQLAGGFGFSFYLRAKIFGNEQEYIIIGIGFGEDLRSEIIKIIDSAGIRE